MARKTWEQLSPAYRERLIRAGVTKQQHASGAPLHKGRGHTSRQREQQQRQQNREINDWARDFARMYGRDADDVKEALREMGKQQAWSAIQRQARMQKLYDEGRTDEAHALWEARDTSLPDWMWYYHGYFS